MADKFEVKYEIDDGYCGSARPQSFYIDSRDIEDMTDEALENLLYEQAHEDMMQKVGAAVSTNPAEFIQWARAMLKAR